MKTWQSIQKVRGGNSTDWLTRSRIVQHQEKMLQEVLVCGLKLPPNKSTHPVQKFHCKDKVSQAWLSALPTALSSIPSDEFQQAMAFQMFVPSPACSPHLGTMIGDRPLDAHGEVLMCAAPTGPAMTESRCALSPWATEQVPSLTLSHMASSPPPYQLRHMLRVATYTRPEKGKASSLIYTSSPQPQ